MKKQNEKPKLRPFADISDVELATYRKHKERGTVPKAPTFLTPKLPAHRKFVKDAKPKYPALPSGMEWTTAHRSKRETLQDYFPAGGVDTTKDYVEAFNKGRRLKNPKKPTIDERINKLVSRLEKTPANKDASAIIRALGKLSVARSDRKRAKNPAGFHNIEKSGFHKNEYVGYSNGVWRITRHGEQWRAVKRDGKGMIDAKTLAILSSKLENEARALNPVPTLRSKKKTSQFPRYVITDTGGNPLESAHTKKAALKWARAYANKHNVQVRIVDSL